MISGRSRHHARDVTLPGRRPAQRALASALALPVSIVVLVASLGGGAASGAMDLGSSVPNGANHQTDGRRQVAGQPANWPIICAVRLSYEVFLDRSPSEEDEQWWATFIDEGIPPHLVGFEAARFYFSLLVASDEWSKGAVTDLYQRDLGRSPDPAGLAFWTGELRRGVQVKKVASLVFGSAESYARSGGTDEAFVTRLYERYLHRSPDASGLAYWVGQVRATSLDGVAGRFFDTYESRVIRLGAIYQDVLGREPDLQGRMTYLDRLLRMDDVRVAIDLAALPWEFFSRSGRVCDPPADPFPF